MEQLFEDVLKHMHKNHAFLLEIKNNNYDEMEPFIIDKLTSSGIKFENIKTIKPKNKVIVKEQIIDMKASFKFVNISTYNVYIILAAETMNQFAYNSLLKFLEEPSNQTIAILITDNINLIPETIKSRCVVKKNNEDEKVIDSDQFKDLLDFINNNNYLSYVSSFLNLLEENSNFINEFLKFLVINTELYDKKLLLNDLIIKNKFNINKNLLIDEIYYIIVNKEM